MRVKPTTFGATFVVVWALANLVHHANGTRGPLDLISILNVLAALWALAAPQSAGRLCLLAGSQVLDAVWHLPFSPDHQLLAAFVNILILHRWLRERPSDSADVVKAVAGGARVVLLIVYAAAALSKYNESFLDPARSCATWIATTASGGLIDRGDGVAAGFLIITLLAETSIPLLLLLPWTRRWGVVIGIGFHLLVCLSPAVGVADFSVTLWALFLLFAHPDDVRNAGDAMRSTLRRSTIVRDLSRVPAPILVGVTTTLIVLGDRTEGGSILLILLSWFVAVVTGAALLVSLVRATLRNRSTTIRLSRLPAVSVFVCLAALALVASPYVGFGTSSRFTMFSGLRTEGPGTNHLFLPSVHVIDSQNRWWIVERVETLRPREGRTTNSSPVTARAAIPEVEIRRLLSDPNLGGTFVSPNGHRVTIKPGVDHPMRGGNRWWEERTQHYRPFVVTGVSDPGFCSN